MLELIVDHTHLVMVVAGKGVEGKWLQVFVMSFPIPGKDWNLYKSPLSILAKDYFGLHYNMKRSMNKRASHLKQGQGNVIGKQCHMAEPERLLSFLL